MSSTTSRGKQSARRRSSLPSAPDAGSGAEEERRRASARAERAAAEADAMGGARGAGARRARRAVLRRSQRAAGRAQAARCGARRAARRRGGGCWAPTAAPKVMKRAARGQHGRERAHAAKPSATRGDSDNGHQGREGPRACARAHVTQARTARQRLAGNARARRAAVGRPCAVRFTRVCAFCAEGRADVTGAPPPPPPPCARHRAAPLPRYATHAAAQGHAPGRFFGTLRRARRGVR